MLDAMAYHHGDLRSVLLTSAAEMVARRGPANMSLRELAREAGVSHAAPAHHFGDRRGLFTALAAAGFNRLAEAVEQTDFHTAAVAYVGFAVDNPGHYAVMFEPALLDPDDPDLQAARRRAWLALEAGVATLTAAQTKADGPTAALAAWSLVHGFASLWSSGALNESTGGRSQHELVSNIADVLFPPAD